jgi:hypothetical protein
MAFAAMLGAVWGAEVGGVGVLPVVTDEAMTAADGDWLIKPIARKAGVYRSADGRQVIVCNGLIARSFRIVPNAATAALDNLMTGESMLRGVKPEATVTIDGETFDVGGLKGQPNYAYLLPEWLDDLQADPKAFALVGVRAGPIEKRFDWKRKRYSADLPWPPPGVMLSTDYRLAGGAVPYLAAVTVAVHYEMYDGLPLMAKWISMHNGSDRAIVLNSFTSEILAMVEGSSSVESVRGYVLPNMHVECDHEFHGMSSADANVCVHWVKDPQYLTQVNYLYDTPCLLECRPPVGPGVTIAPGESFESFRTYELIHDSTDRERQGLAQRRMYRTVAPWVTENPIMMHVRSARPEAVRLAIDQCAEVGFEMIILTFGSGFDIENEDPAYIAQIKELVDYAHGKGIELGGYSLLASRRISDEHDVVNPETGRPGGFAAFGNSPCTGSAWGQDYFRKLYAFFEKTGFDLLEHDGSYPGDVCASTTHPGHAGLADSQYRQWKTITDFYKWCRGRGIYLNVPDYYYLSGTTKSGMGYRETNWSLPRAQQIIHGRQNIYDGTWQKTPSMGWMFVPLTEYHGGGPAATIEPLAEHLDAYEAHLANNFGLGVQACYRGPRLYDTDETKAVVKRWVDFYKKHRAIMDSDLIHVRRADGRDIDCMMHVNPSLKEKGLAMVYNPTDRCVQKDLKLNLYYTGLTDKATIREQDGKAQRYTLDREYSITVPIDVPARNVTWLVIE